MTNKEPRIRTTYAVWEITLACNLRCIHCGSRAGKARPGELSTAEALDLVEQLADIGVREVSLIGGEAFLRSDWLEIARAIKQSGMKLGMTTGGYGLGPKLAERMAEVGFDIVSVSVDGLQATHDSLRGRKNSWYWCFQAIQALRSVGIKCASNTQINRRSAAQLPRIYEHLREAGITAWQTQLTVPMGNAADRPEILLQPAELLDVLPMLHYLHQRGKDEGLYMYPGNNIGYFGPYERRLRSSPRDANDLSFWAGSQGGVMTLGIEADGTIKADPSLPTDDFAGGNIREQSLREIVFEADRLKRNDERSTAHLWGFCSTCEFADICRGGDTWTSHVFFDRDGNNPYCHHRSLHHAARGLQERLRLRDRAAGIPFDNGVFEIAVEPLDFEQPDASGFALAQVEWPAAWLAEDPELPTRLRDERDRSVEVWRRTRLAPQLVQLGVQSTF
jgi:radical SAM protein with 4Fe4S-binding SPASM domain